MGYTHFINMSIPKAAYKAFAIAVRDISDYAVENPLASPINVVYMFREELRKLLRSNPNFDEEAFLAACRRRQEVPEKPVYDLSSPDEWD